VILPVLHNLEQVSSDEHVGSLAENLLEALKENEKVSAKVRAVFTEMSALLHAAVTFGIVVVTCLYCVFVVIMPHLNSYTNIKDRSHAEREK